MRMRAERGFTIMELLVAAGLAVLIVGSAMAAFTEARRVMDTSARMVDMNQNLRVGVSFITRDLIQTGRSIPTGGIPFPAGTGAAAIKRPGPPGTVLQLPAGWTVLPGIVPGAGLGPTVNGVVTDVVTSLHDDPTLALDDYPLTAVANDGSSMQVDARTPIGNASNGIKAGDLIWFTNSVGNAIQTVTRVSGQNVFFDQGDPFGFNQRAAAQGTIMAIRTGTTFPPTTATRVVMVTYYLDATTAPGNPRLVRQFNFSPSRVIAMGIENLQVSYDVVDGATNPTNQKTPVAPNSAQQIRKINLFVEARAAAGGPGDAPLRNGVATQVSLRSMSFMDRYR
jgi:hypothetical protein